jgi:FlaA1/EpsC-like NDP-sugar epimerase
MHLHLVRSLEGVSMGKGASRRIRDHFGLDGARSLRAWRPLVDFAAWVLAVVLATCLRYDFHFHTNSWAGLVAMLGIGAAVLVALGGFQGLYVGRWPKGSFEEAEAVAVTVFGVTVSTFALDFVIGHPVPASAVLAAGPMGLGIMIGTRVLRRLDSRRPPPDVEAQNRVIVFGAGEAGKGILGSMVRAGSRTYEPVALLDDDAAKANLRLHGVAVRGRRTDLRRVALETAADTLLIAVPGADSALMRDLTDRAIAAGLVVKVLPRVSELLDRMPSVGDIRPVSFADLIGRREVEVDLDSIAGYLAGKRVLVTGAGGSIGSELCRQVHHYAPHSLIMLDRDESALHALQMSLDGRAMLDEPRLVVADIRDRPRLERVFVEHAPEVVFHAAALKHLTLLELHPEEALKTNVVGTLNLLQVASAAGVERFVNISTDKAADPICTLGYSKRIAERLTAWYAVTTGEGGDRRFLSVRFGNVLGSRGSVLTAFRQQIADKRPLTVTHPEVTRYFMTVEEAVRLVIQAGAVGSRGQVLVLDMGDPVRIADVAERLIGESGVHVPIEYTGLRPGEKLHERLFGRGEQDERPIHPQISHVPVPALAPVDVEGMVGVFEPDAVVDGLRAAVAAPIRLTSVESALAAAGASSLTLHNHPSSNGSAAGPTPLP